MKSNNWKYLYRIRQLEIKSWMKYLMLQGKEVIDYVLGELTTGTDIRIDNTVEKKFYKFDIKGNSVQDGTPSPETEVPILSAGDNGSISEKIVNKNLFDKNNVRNGYRLGADGTYFPHTGYSASEFIGVLPNTTYYRNKQMVVYAPVCTYKRDRTFIARITSGYTFTTPADCYYIRTAVKNEDLDTTQLEQGSTATIYVAHQEQIYTIPTQQPMRSIGTVRDEFIKVNGNWFERHNIGRFLYVGTENIWQKDTTYNRFFIYNNVMLNTPVSTRQPILSNYFKYASSGGAVGTAFRYNDYLYFYSDSSLTLEEFKTWLSTHNLEVICELKTPTDLPCTSEQIAILENLPKSYNEQTNIYSLDVTPAYIEVQAYVKKEEVIEND